MSSASRQAPSHLRRPQGTASTHLDALRGIAAVSVCLSHLRDFFFQDYQKLPHHNPLLAAGYLVTGLGHQWVIVFFVLSGYLVGGSVLRSVAVDRWSWRAYLLNRLTRLYAVLVPALVLGGLLDLTGIHIFGTDGIYGGNTGTHELTFAVQSRLSIPIMIGNYAFLQGMYVPTFGSNGPLWSLANEFWYYIAFPFMVCALWPRLSVPLRLLNVLLLVAVLVFVHPKIALMGLIWLMGVAIHYLPPLPIDIVFVRRLSIPAAVLACSAVLVWCKQTRFVGADYVLGIAVAALMYAVLSCSRTSMPSAYNWTAEVLSRSSYTLYLVHVPFLVFLAAWMAQARWVPTPGHVLIGCAIFAVVMLYAQLVWFLFEKRTDSLRTRVKPWFLGSSNRSAKAEPHSKAATSA
ncbi:MAG TPA: acyltransferase [Silvibacterium sp.]|nr:acyltransferase [Silvibacterium sp.]